MCLHYRLPLAGTVDCTLDRYTTHPACFTYPTCLMSDKNVTEALHQFSPDDADSSEKLLKAIHGELEEIANRYHAKFNRVVTIDPSALIGELYIKLHKRKNLEFPNRKEFYAYAAVVMRNYMIDYTRKKHMNVNFVSEEKAFGLEEEISYNTLIDFNRCIDKLKEMDGRLGEVAELRIYAGLNNKELAEHFLVSTKTIGRDLDKIRGIMASLRKNLKE